jgi:hypothetical protein
MLRVAGKGMRMWNVDPRLKDALPDYRVDALPDCRVIGGNADEAVAGYLDQLFGGK